MARVEPRAFLRFLVDEWPLVEAVYERGRHGPLRANVLREVAGLGTQPRALERLFELNVLVPLPHSPTFEMSDFVQDLVAHLKREHTLGLAGELRAHLEDLATHTSGITEALDNVDHDRLHRHVISLSTRIKTLLRHLDNNTAAVEDIVTRAKTRQRQIPVRQRYAEVLEAWDFYIEPLREMVEPRGPFEAQFERLEGELGNAMKRMESHGGVVKDQRDIEVLTFRLVQLRSQLKIHLTSTTEPLFPLVREVRRNSIIARGASVAIKMLRRGEMDGLSLTQLMPFCRREIPNAIADLGEIEAYIADLADYRPAPQPFPVAPADLELPPLRPPFDADAVVGRLRAEPRTGDLLGWLIDTCGEETDVDDILDLYFTVAGGESGLDATASTRRVQYETRTHRITAAKIAVRSARGAE